MDIILYGHDLTPLIFKKANVAITGKTMVITVGLLRKKRFTFRSDHVISTYVSLRKKMLVIKMKLKGPLSRSDNELEPLIPDDRVSAEISAIENKRKIIDIMMKHARETGNELVALATELLKLRTGLNNQFIERLGEILDTSAGNERKLFARLIDMMKDRIDLATLLTGETTTEAIERERRRAIQELIKDMKTAASINEVPSSPAPASAPLSLPESTSSVVQAVAPLEEKGNEHAVSSAGGGEEEINLGDIAPSTIIVNSKEDMERLTDEQILMLMELERGGGDTTGEIRGEILSKYPLSKLVSMAKKEAKKRGLA